MNLQECLSYLRSYLDDGSQALVDGDSDILWSDDLLLAWLNEGARLLARASWCLIDEGVAPAGVITLATGKAVYDLDKSVLRVLSATPEDQEWPLGRASDSVLRGVRYSAESPFNIDTTGDAETGRPIAFSTDAGHRQMRVFRVPTSTENGLLINLKVARLPVPLSLDNTEARFETPEDYDLVLCHYAAGRALMQPNVDGQQRTIGRDLMTEFNDAMRDARRDRQRAEMEPARWNFASDTAGL